MAYMMPSDADADATTAREGRIKAFQNYMAQYPGAAPGGTGETGLQRYDSQGWSNLLNTQKAYLDDVSAEKGGGPLASRLGSYDGTQGSGLGGSSGAAVSGLRTAVNGAAAHLGQGGSAAASGSASGSGNPGPAGAAGGNPFSPRDEPELYRAYEMAQLNGLQAQSSAARRSMLTPLDLAGEKADAAVRYQPTLDALDRDSAYDDSIMKSKADSANYWQRGAPMQDNQMQRTQAVADAAGDRALQLEQAKAAAAAGVANINAGAKVQTGQVAAQGAAQVAALNGLRGELGNSRQYGDAARVGTLAPQFDQQVAQLQQGGGAPQPAGGKTLTEAQLQQKMQQFGWTRQQAVQQAQQYGYTIAGQ